MDKKEIQELIDYINESLAEAQQKWDEKMPHPILIGLLEAKLIIVKDMLEFKLNKL